VQIHQRIPYGGAVRPRRLLSIPITLLLAVGASFGGDAPLAGAKVCVLPFADLLSPASEAQLYARKLSQSLELELRRIGVILIPAGKNWDGSTPEQLIEPSTAISAARAVGADIAINGFVALDAGMLRVSVRVYDAKSGVLVAGLLRSFPFDVSFYSLLWPSVEEMLAGAIPAPRPVSSPDRAAATTPPQPPAILTFTSSQEGMEVLLADGTSLGRIEKGLLTLPDPGIEVNGTFVVEKRLAGYHSARQTVGAGGEIRLAPLSRSARFGLEGNVTAGPLPGFGTAFRLYLEPDTLFLSPSLSVEGHLPATSGGSPGTHVDTAFLVGAYVLFPPDSAFRLGVSAGVGAIFSWVPSSTVPVFFDPYVDIANLSLELNLPRLSIFLRSGLQYTLGGATPNLLGQGIDLWEGFLPPLTLGALFTW
jgi:TolB-like protein